jgi:hypothetical protein
MSTVAVSALRQRMIEDMTARQLGRHSQRSHSAGNGSISPIPAITTPLSSAPLYRLPSHAARLISLARARMLRRTRRCNGIFPATRQYGQSSNGNASGCPPTRRVI